MKRTLTAAVLLGVGVSGASAQQLQMNGSDTLFEMMNDPTDGVLSQCPAADAFIDYLGAGSSTGENNMKADAQEVSPMSRFLNASACADNPDTDSGCYLHSLDGLAVAAVESATENCDALRWSGTMSLPSGGTYTFDNWRTVLRIVYGGISSQAATITGHNPCLPEPPARSPIAEKDCGSEIRRTLINTWSNMFQGGCTNGACTELKHAFRRDDASGTTDTFLELLALPNISATVAPFCNGTEIDDLDPVRRACTGTGFANGEQVCKRNVPASGVPTATTEGLGVVLPVLTPQANPFAGASQLCANVAVGGSFGDVGVPFGTTSCPDGTGVRGGNCRWPKRQGSAAGTGFNCINGRNNLPLGLPSGTFDGRVYNLTLRNAAGQTLTYQRRNANGTIANRPMTSAYYRLHQNRTITGSTLPANTGCALPDSTEQIGCLVEASPCSIGFAGLTALNDPATGTDDLNRKGLSLRSVVGGGAGVAVAPNATNVRLFLQPSGAACSADEVLDGGFEDRYPLSRGLWLCTVDGVPSATGIGDLPGTQTTDQLASQFQLAQCFQNRTIVDRAANKAGFITLDTTGATPVNFISCP